MGNNDMHKYIQETLHKQVLHMFQSLEKAEDMKDSAGLNTRAATLQEMGQRILLDDVKFTLERKPSSIEGAGEGAFIQTKTSVPPGTLVALYPGLVHIKHDLKDPTYFNALMPDPNLMLMVRMDQMIIDGRAADKMPHNPYAQGHLINHCGADRKPNVFQVSVPRSSMCPAVLAAPNCVLAECCVLLIIASTHGD
jgi:hypothetical protein